MNTDKRAHTDGYTLWNSDTALGRALRKHFPTEVTSFELHIKPDSVPEIVVRSLVPADLLDCPEWEELFAQMREQNCELSQKFSPVPVTAESPCVERYREAFTSVVASNRVSIETAIKGLVHTLAKNASTS